MIFKVDEDGKLEEIEVPPAEEDLFIEIQKEGKIKFIKVSPEQLPKCSKFIKCFYRLNKDGEIVIDVDRLKTCQKKQLNDLAVRYIKSKLVNLDWGNTYEECLAELNSSAQVTETKILYLLKPHKSDLTLTEVRQKIAEYLAGTYTAEDVVKEMQEAGLTEEETQKYLSLLGYAVEVAKLLYWVEEVWDYVERKEKEIEQTTTVEELEKIEIKFPELKEA